MSNTFSTRLLKESSLKDVVKSLKDRSFKNIKLKGLYSSAKSFAIIEIDRKLNQKDLHLIILKNREDCSGCTNDLYSITDPERVLFFPPSKGDSSNKVQRTTAIKAISDHLSIEDKTKRKSLYIVSWPESLEEEIINEKELKKSYFTIKKGDSLSHDFLKELLFTFGFEKVDFISKPGEFALRGSIIDLFSFSDNRPYRLDFFGDEIDEIKFFDPNTQRSVESVEKIDIFPNLFDESIDVERVDIFSFLPEDTIVWISEIDSSDDFLEKSSHLRKINLSSLDIDKKIIYDTEVEFNTTPQPTFNKNFDILAKDIREKEENGYEVVIMSENQSQIERLREIFGKFDIKLLFENYTIESGFIDHDSKICLYTDHQIFERFRKVNIRKSVEKSERLTINDLNSFHIGDYIVHIDHGVGQFGGLVKTNVNGRIQEAVKLIYKDGDVLFVSIHGLHRISKYKSKDAAAPKIYKLGTAAWLNLKTKTKSKVKDIAKELIKLYAERRVAKGFAFSQDSYLQKELESSFMYEDTPDQIKANSAIKDDMERDYPMDRLVCGDVGFGKTELAIRAAFKAVSDSKQVAVLVPTTILALQHHKTFSSRLKSFPCNIEMISRLRTAAQAKDIIERLHNGKIDIIIGTHRLLNKQIQFRDLGLLVIDEEQKFGVGAKEKLRQLKLSVDTLTLTATPIPRTLQFSLLGARDLSIINTPPPNRIPIHTEIIDFNEEQIRDILKYEIDRGGQIFFVHNKVEDILAVEDIIRRILPGIKTIVAHGQMEAEQLEKRVLDFIEGYYDVLIATTIIENGIDIPNANTIIINQAQNFGLSDLHQLRGRVGRSNQKAYCYLIVPPMTTLSDDARRRLNAIEAFSDLGSGFNIAMQDLDIRGMGNLLGGEQSGFIAEMGFETYQKILAEAFAEMKGQYGTEEEDKDLLKGQSYITDCIIDTDLDLRIPDTYINITAEKIRLYKELDTITGEEELNRFRNELKDRFGEIPEELMQLTYIVTLRRIAIKIGIEKIVLKNGEMLAWFISDPKSPFYQSELFTEIMTYLSKMRNITMKEQKGKLYISVKNIKSVESALKFLSLHSLSE